MGKNSGGSEINNANNYYQQLANDANQMVGYFQQYDLPMLKTLSPILMDTLQGKPSALMNAAQAPVLAQTASQINSLRSNPAGIVNPNALYQDMAMSGQQNAGLAGDQMLAQSLSAIQNLMNMGYGGASAGMSGLGNAAGGEGNLGLGLNQQGNEWWQSLLGAAGTYAGYSMGKPGGLGGGNPSAMVSAPGIGLGGGITGGLGAFAMTPSGTTMNSSSPISSGQSSYLPPPYPTGNT